MSTPDKRDHKDKRKGGNNRRNKPQKEFNELLLEVRRVTRVTTGGRRMSFRATVLVGNKKGKIGVGVSKGPDVSTAVKKAAREAYKDIFIVPITNANTVPYTLTTKFKACRVKLIPASAGTGLKAGSSVRSVLELAGYENILSKIIGSNNKLNNAIATINALTSYKHAEDFTLKSDKKKETTAEVKKDEKKEVKVDAPKNTTEKKEKVVSEVKKEETKKTEKKATEKDSK